MIKSLLKTSFLLQNNELECDDNSATWYIYLDSSIIMMSRLDIHLVIMVIIMIVCRYNVYFILGFWVLYVLYINVVIYASMCIY